ncbi:uncharacterized protein [Rutidosis leptorrhynchoides]|uniref:uncharacterized protein n=1 Tax=Rutidosis leptorrhynchoides TaxID=125765 RepID=UPI003A98ED0E
MLESNTLPIVWFSHCIPKHAFVMWLLMGERLKTQDRLKSWELKYNPILKCSLCKGCMDSHAHLFFECSFSTQVWKKVKDLMIINVGTNNWKVCRDLLVAGTTRQSAKGVVDNLCFAASVYFLWQERNNRLFNKPSSSVDQLFELIRSTVRLKLMTVTFKSSMIVTRIKEVWQLS